MNILKKVQFYKRALQVMFAFNVAVIVAGVVAAVSYFSSIHHLKELTEQNTQKLSLLSTMQNDVVTLATHPIEKKISYEHIKRLESLRLKLESWPGSSFAQIILPETLEPTGVSPQVVLALQERIMKEQSTLREHMSAAAQNMSSLAQQLAWFGLFAFVFGILLPILLFKKLNFEINKARLQIESHTSHWMAQWFETHSKHGEKPLQDPVFWLKIILLSVETFAPQSQNPMMNFIGEFAPTLRKELDREREIAISKLKDKKTA